MASWRALSPFGFEEKPGLRAVVFLALAGAGWAATRVIVGLDDAWRVSAATGLFVLLTLASAALFPVSRWITWAWLCAPAAIAFHRAGLTSFVPWAVAFGLVLVLSLVLEARRAGRVRACLSAAAGGSGGNAA
jgi:hypothetical protein